MIHRLSALRPRGGPGMRALTLSFAASSGIQLINVVTGVLIARELGVEGRGELAAALLLPTLLAAIGGLGVHEAITYRAAKGDASLGGLIGSSLLLAGLQTCALILIGAFLIPLVLSRFDDVALHGAYLYLTFIPLHLTTMSLLGLLNGLERYRAFNALRFSYAVSVGVGLGLLAVLDEFRVTTAVGVYVIGQVIALAATSGYVARLQPGRPTVDRALTRGVLGFGLKTHLSTVSSMLNERIDQLVISIFLEPVKLGLYVVAVTMTSLTALVGGTVAFVALPRVAKLEHGPARIARIRRLMAATLVGATVVSIPIALFTPQLIDFFFGEEFVGASDVARVLLLAGIVLSLNRALAAALKAVGRPLDAGIAEVIALGVTFAGLATLLPVFGLLGAGLASLAAYSMSLIWMTRQASRILQTPVGRLVRPGRSGIEKP